MAVALDIPLLLSEIEKGADRKLPTDATDQAIYRWPDLEPGSSPDAVKSSDSAIVIETLAAPLSGVLCKEQPAGNAQNSRASSLRLRTMNSAAASPSRPLDSQPERHSLGTRLELSSQISVSARKGMKKAPKAP